MSDMVYLQPDIDRGRATGGFHLVKLQASDRGKHPTAHRMVSMGAGLMIATVGSVVLWTLIAIILF